MKYGEKSFNVAPGARPPADCERAGGHGSPDRRGRCVYCGTKLAKPDEAERERFRERRVRRDMKRAGLNPDSVSDRFKFEFGSR